MRKIHSIALILVLATLVSAEVVEEEKNPAAIFGKFTLWFLLTAYALRKLQKKQYSQKAYVASMLLSLAVAGFILGSEPSSVGVIQDTVLMLVKNQIFIPRFVGLLVFISFILLAGRIFCGICCPFGIFQELASRLGLNRITLPNKTANTIRGVFVFLMFAYTIAYAASFYDPINPFSIFKHEVYMLDFDRVEVTALASGLLFLTLSVFTYRPFCRLACPYGHIAKAGANKAMYVLARDEKCIDCKRCEQICPTKQAERDHPHTECYYCRRCIEVCPTQAILLKKRKDKL